MAGADKIKLTDKQAAFIREYLVDLNATQAAIRAGYSANTATVIAHETLSKPYIQEALKCAMDKRASRTEITADRVLKEYARLGFFDPRKLFDKDGKPLEIQDIDDDTAAVLSGLDVQEIYEGTGVDKKFVGFSKKYKLADKKGALDSIARHLGMFIDKQEISGKDGGPLEVIFSVSRPRQDEEVIEEAIIKDIE